MRERYTEERLLDAARAAEREGLPMAASGIYERVQALRDGGPTRSLEVNGLRNLVTSSRSPFKGLDETKPQP